MQIPRRLHCASGAMDARNDNSKGTARYEPEPFRMAPCLVPRRLKRVPFPEMLFYQGGCCCKHLSATLYTCCPNAICESPHGSGRPQPKPHAVCAVEPLKFPSLG